MKQIHKIYLLAGIVILAGMFGCKKFTDEENLGNRTAETYYITPSGFEDQVKSNYTALRGIHNFPQLFNIGTDVYSTPSITDVNGLNLYNNNFNTFNGDVDNFYRQLYTAINYANNTLYWATQVQGMNATTLGIRVAEAKALRAYYYFLLAETFGDVPLVLTRTTGITLVYTRTPEKDIYAQVIQDLNEAMPVLQPTTPDFGRVTRGFAQHLLAKVYLTRGYKSYGGGNADFQQAATLAENLTNPSLSPYALKAKFSDLFDPTVANFQVNNEVIFSVQYSTNINTNNNLANTGGNTLQQWFLWDTQQTGLVGRSTFYGKTNNALALDPYFFSLFNKTSDSRYTATVHEAVITQTAGSYNGKNFAVGDTLIYYPIVPFTPAQKALRKYIVVNPDEYRSTVFIAGLRNYPQFKKFRDPAVPGYVDNAGTRDTYVFRLAEDYLIAAEAYVKLNNQAKALPLLNAIRTRAAKTGTNPVSGLTYAAEMQFVGNVTLDVILEERARELVGEELRWYELKRTGKLIERVLLYNDEAKAANAIKPFHLLRPIPQAMIDLNRGTFPQNPGY